ncbi:MAG: thioredoxin family protein [bacterium]
MGLKIGEKAYDFSLMGVNGKIYSFASFADSPILVVVFWCNHCPYVRAYEDRTIDLARFYRYSGVKFAAINSNDPVKYPEDNFTNMKVRAKEVNYPFPYLWDETQEVARNYGAKHTPEFYLLDSERILRYHGALDDNWEDPLKVKTPYLRLAIEAVLQGKEPPVTETTPVGCSIKWR